MIERSCLFCCFILVLMAMTTQQLMSQQPHVRKRASQCLGALSVSLADDLLQKLLQQLLQQVPLSSMLLSCTAQNFGYHT